jgi:pyrimidine-nucleoside phosphorylase
VEDVCSIKEGYISHIHTDEIGMTSLILGGGRETKESDIDLTVGMKIHKKIGDFVTLGTPLATLYANDQGKLAAAKERFLNSYTITLEKAEVPNHIYGIVTKDGIQKF